MRLSRICSQEDGYVKRTMELKKYLVDRGYDGMEIHCYISQATSVKRTKALRKKPKDTLGERVPLVVTYHPQLRLFNR